MLFGSPLRLTLLQVIHLVVNLGNASDLQIGVLQEWPHSDRKLVDTALELIRQDLLGSAPIRVSLTDVTSGGNGEYLLNLTLTIFDLVQNGVSGVIGHVDCPTAHVLANFLSARTVPTILIVPVACRMVQPPGVFWVKPDLDALTRTVQEVIFTQRLATMLIFYDNSTDRRLVMTLFEQRQVGNTPRVAALYMGEHLQSPYNELLITLTSIMHDCVCILLQRPAAIHALLQQVSNLGLNTPFQTWIVVHPDLLPPGPPFPGEWDKGNLLRIAADSALQAQGLLCPQGFLNLRSYLPTNMTSEDTFVLDALLILSKALTTGQKNDSAAPYSASVCSPTVNGSEGWIHGDLVAENIRQTDFHGRSGRTHFGATGKNVHTVIEVWAAGTPDEHSLRAQWTLAGGLLKHSRPLLPNQPNNLHNRRFKVGVVRSAPYVMATDETGKSPNFSGFCIDIVDVLSSVLNFSVEYIDGGEDYGTMKNGEWTGMIGKVTRKEVDFAAAAFSVTEAREEVVDFTVSFKEDSTGFMLKRPGKGQRMTRVFLPFNPSVWAAIFGSVFLIGLLLVAVRVLLSDHGKGPAHTAGSSSVGVLRLLADNVWFAYGTSVEQSMDDYPTCQSGRVLVVFWWLFTITMSATYTANLVAFLTVTLTEKPISTLQELADECDILPLIQPGNALNDIFQAPDALPVYRQIWDQVTEIPQPLPTTMKQILKLVETGRYSFINDVNVLSHIVVNHCDRFVLGKETFRPLKLAFILPQGSKYKQLIDINIAKMHEAGLMQKWHSRWWTPRSAMCVASVTSQWRHTEMETLAGAFLVLAGAVSVALVALVVELQWSRLQQQRGETRQPPALDAESGGVHEEMDRV